MEDPDEIPQSATQESADPAAERRLAAELAPAAAGLPVKPAQKLAAQVPARVARLAVGVYAQPVAVTALAAWAAARPLENRLQSPSRQPLPA